MQRRHISTVEQETSVCHWLVKGYHANSPPTFGHEQDMSTSHTLLSGRVVLLANMNTQGALCTVIYRPLIQTGSTVESVVWLECPI